MVLGIGCIYKTSTSPLQGSVGLVGIQICKVSTVCVEWELSTPAC